MRKAFTCLLAGFGLLLMATSVAAETPAPAAPPTAATAPKAAASPAPSKAPAAIPAPLAAPSPAATPAPTAPPAAAPLGTSAAKRGVMVWRLEAKSGVSGSDVDSLTGIVTSQVAQLSGEKVISESDIRTILKGEETRQKCGAEDVSCVTEIGAALGVPEAISGDLGRLGTIWILNLRRINVRTAAVITRATRQVDGPIEALVKAVPQAVGELYGRMDIAPTTFDKGESAARNPALKPAGWALFGSGAALIVLGGVGHWQAKQANGDDKSAFNLWRGVAFAGYAVGGAALLTGTILLIVDGVAAKKEAASGLAFGASPARGGATLTVLGRF